MTVIANSAEGCMSEAESVLVVTDNIPSNVAFDLIKTLEIESSELLVGDVINIITKCTSLVNFKLSNFINSSNLILKALTATNLVSLNLHGTLYLC
jgi:hypothetical protein